MAFQKGTSGNPTGRAKGSRNKATLLAEQLLDGEAEILIRKAIELAKAGDSVALRLCLDRIVPARRDRPVNITIPKLATADDACQAMAAVTNAVAEGELTPGEASELARVVEAYAKAIEITEIERRVSALEQRQARQ